MNRYVNYNCNTLGRNVGDCTVRAISKATGQSWEQTYVGIALQGLMLGDMPSSNPVWGAYLKRLGFRRELAPDPEDGLYTVQRFCEEHPLGTYVLALSGHVVAVVDGRYYDTWDSGDKTVLYFWKREESA